MNRSKWDTPVIPSKESVEKFRKLYKNRFGKDLEYQEALDKATKLLNLVRIVYRPILIKDLLGLFRMDMCANLKKIGIIVSEHN